MRLPGHMGNAHGRKRRTLSAPPLGRTNCRKRTTQAGPCTQTQRQSYYVLLSSPIRLAATPLLVQSSIHLHLRLRLHASSIDPPCHPCPCIHRLPNQGALFGSVGDFVSHGWQNTSVAETTVTSDFRALLGSHLH